MTKKINVKILALLTILMVVISITNVVNAYSVGVEMTADKNLVAGTEIAVSVKIKNLNIGNGIDAFLGTFNYDTNVFEGLTTSSLVATNGWNPVFNPSTNIFSLLNNSKVNTASTILVAKFKVKNSISVSSTDIKLTNITVSGGAVVDGGTGDIDVSNATLTISKPVVAPTLNVTKAYDAATNKVTVTVKADRKMTNSKVAAGWTLSSDSLTYTKVFDQNVSSDIDFAFEDGTTSTKAISVTEIKNSSNTNTTNTTNNTNTTTTTGNTDKTVAKTILPATGISKGVILIFAIISVFGIINFGRYKHLNKNMK